MDQMMKLSAHQLNGLRDHFATKPDGLSMEEFISVMSRALPHEKGTRLSETAIHNLRELFLQVDVNGDGTMEWDEFTGFCIDQGIAATVSHGSSAIPDQLYVESTKYVDKSRSFDSLVEKIEWIPELEKIFVCESKCSSLKVYDPDRGRHGPLLLHEINLDHSKSEHLHETKGAHKDKIKLAPAKGAEKKSVVHPTCVEYIPELGMIAVAMSDIAISFWDVGVYRRDPDNGIPWFVKRVFTEKLVLKMAWCGPAKTLFTCGGLTTGNILAWKVMIEGQMNQLTCRKVATMKGHKDVVTDLLSVVQMRGVHVEFCGLVSASLDRKLLIWDTETYTIKGKRKGHKMGVRALSAVTGKNDGNLVLSSGFDSEVLLWEVGGLADKPLMRLTGHTAAVVQARTHSDGRIVTIDNLCVIKWWHIGSDFSDSNNAECIQTVLPFMGMGTSVPVPTTMVVAGLDKRILVGTKSMRVFDLVRVRPKTQPAIGILYNRTSMTIVAAQARNVKTWNATTGLIDSNFHDCCDHKVSHDADIAALCLDRRHRKFVTADLAGSVSVYNYMNGALMKRASLLHSKEISCMVYCEADQCIVTSSWDRSWKVLDEDAGNMLPVLRTVNMAHDYDISTVAHSHLLNLVATGDSNGVVKIWDFQFGTHEGTCCELNEEGKGVDITCMTFLEPYPLLAVADGAGHLYLYTVRPWYKSYRLARSTFNVITDQFGQSTTWPITTMKYKYDSNGGEIISEGITSGRCLLVVGDENGNVGVYDAMPVVRACGLTAIRDKDMPTLRNNYNARRKAEMYGEGYASPEAWIAQQSKGRSSNRSRVPSKADSDLSETSVASSIGGRLNISSVGGVSMIDDSSDGGGSSILDSSLPRLPAISKKTTRGDTKGGRRASRMSGRSVNRRTLLTKSASATSLGLGSAGGASMMASRRKRGGGGSEGSDGGGGVGGGLGGSPKSPKKSASKSETVMNGPLLDPATAPVPILLHRWLAHEGKSVRAIDVNIDDGDTNAVPFILSSGADLVLRAFSLEGRPLGFLTKGDEVDKTRRKPYPWISLVDLEAQKRENLVLTRATLESVLEEEDAQEKADLNAELNRQRALSSAELSKSRGPSRPASPKSDSGGMIVDDVDWRISKGSKGDGWEQCHPRLTSALEMAYQEDREMKRLEKEAEAARLEAEAKMDKDEKKKKKKKKKKDEWEDSDDEKKVEEIVEPGVVISIRGNKSLFDPDRMTLKSLDKQDAEKLRLQRKDQNSAALEAKEKLLRLDDDRRRVVGQLMGETTWVLTDLERGRMMAEEEERAKKEAIRVAASKKKSEQEKKDAEMQELLSDPPPIKEGGEGDVDAVKLPYDHPGNWSMGSKNRLQMLYPNHHSEHHRTQVQEENRHHKHSPTSSPVGSSDEGEDEDDDAAWLRNRLKEHGDLISQLDMKKERQQEQAKEAQERLRLLLEQQKEVASEKRREHDLQMKMNPEYRAKVEAAKKPAVPPHRVKKMTISSSAPKLTVEVAREARRISKKLAASGVMSPKLTSPQKIRERMKYVMRDLERDVKSALDVGRRGKGGRKGGRNSGGRNNSHGDISELTEEEKEDQARAEAEEAALKEKRRAERRAALKDKLHFGTYTKEHILHMRQSFKQMDADGSGNIDLEEFLEAQEQSHMSDHMASMFHAMDQDGDGNVSLREMCSVVFFKAPPREMNDIIAFLSMPKTPRLEVEIVNPITNDEIEELRQIFDLYDEDGGGTLDRMEIYKALGVVSGYSAQTGMSLVELDAMIDEADVDGGGTIDKEEFVKMMSHVTHGVATFDPW